MSLGSSLKRSSSLISGLNRHRYHTIRLFRNQAGESSSSSSLSSSSPSSLNLFLKSVSVIAAGSGLGYWFSNSSYFSSAKSGAIAFADWTTQTNPPSVLQQQDDSAETSEKKKRKFLFGDAYRRKVFFNYEKRIRMRSPPEKVFEYFASFVTPEGEVLMRPADLMRAIVPVFPPSESNNVREGYLRGERSPEGELRYIFFVTLLSIPESSFSIAFKMFDLDYNGEIDRDEFKRVMTWMRALNRQGAHHRDGKRTGLKVSYPVENGGLLEYFFGKDGTSCLQHEKFVEFLRNLHNEILLLEFNHYDYKHRGTISAKDFAFSMVAAADMSNINQFLARVDKLDNEPHLREIRITLEEFMAFAEIRKKLAPLSLAIFSYGTVNGLFTKKDFQRAASNVCGVTLSDKVVDIIFHVFDTNADGNLSANEFVKVLHRRESGMGQTVTELGVLGSVLNCA
ncbi:calcium uptake protein, mitochondrial-like isoform X2 [Papaver somniferum]|uniref:calcium uptake protein, mitochondrial-like isoform X2 n=1 Tax=Papaver somniferum TaxID=3469 RepID=UPI000E6FE834|nr:calcium uptake protein, mitochondrial-like isoform X2 [Papaver somniferum]